jgi:hypothetical protein
VVEAALMAVRATAAPWKTPLALAVMLALLLALALSGQWPGVHGKLSSSPKGLLAIAPNEIEHIDLRAGAERVAMRRQPGGWSIEGIERAVPAELVSHIDTALKFLKVSEPSREIAAGELAAESFAAFGLDPPSEVAVLETRSAAVVATVNFGTENPPGTSHYVRLGGAPTVYLMPRHVADEWRLVFDMARRLQGKIGLASASRGVDLLLPVSMAQVWAVEIVAGGKLTRFERDAAGAWFKHLGQHTHAAGGDVHVADPAQATIIDAAFRGFDAAVAERQVGPGDAPHVAQYGLALPTLIVLFYVRDSSTPVARLEFGAPADRLDRYARLAPNGAIITVAEFEPKRLIELLKAIGAGS